jgi:DNA-binding MarR family transcriptional regulator
MTGLNRETRIQILQFLWEIDRENPTRIVRGKELMDHLAIDSYTLESNLSLLSDLKWVRLLGDAVDARAFIKLTDAGKRQIDHLSDG